MGRKPIFDEVEGKGNAIRGGASTAFGAFQIVTDFAAMERASAPAAAAGVRVLVDARGRQPGYKGHAGRGIGRYAECLIEALALLPRHDWELELLAAGDLPWPPFASEAGAALTVHRSPAPPGSGRVRTLLGDLLAAPRTARRARPALLHVLSHLDTGLAAGLPLVITVHDSIPTLFPHLYDHYPLWRWVVRSRELAALRQASEVITDSNAVRVDLLRLHPGLDPDRVHVVPLAASVAIRPAPAAAAEAVRRRYALGDHPILHLGSVDARKNLLLLVRSFARARRAGMLPAGTTLVLAGTNRASPQLVHLAAEAERLGVREALRLPGFIPEPELAAFYAAADVVVMPSLYEGFGLPVLEAMAAGCPVICSAAAAHPEVAGDAALLVPPADEEAWAGALACVLGEPGRRAEMGARGAQRAAQFSWAATAAGTLDVYRVALGRLGGRAWRRR